MERHGATQWQAEQVEDHPHAEYVLEYTIAKGLTPKEAAAQGKLWKVIDTRDDSSNHALAWGVTAYEAWQLARPRIAKRPAFHQCRFEVQT
jgi:hypothetical protein